MLEEGGIVDAGRQHRDIRRALAGRRRDGLQRAQQHLRILPDRRHAVAGKKLREEVHHRLAVLQHVGDAGGRAQIVLQHVELVLADPHDVDADDVAVDVERRVVADHLRQEGIVAEDQVGGDAAGADDLLAMVDVVEEGVERPHPLLDAALQVAPFMRGNDARHEIEGDQPLQRVLAAVDGKGDAEPAEENLRLLLLALEAVTRVLVQPFGHVPIGRPD